MNNRMLKLIFLLSIVFVGATQTLEAARNKKKQNKLNVKKKTCYYPNFKDPIGLIQFAWNISKSMNARKAISMKNKKKEAMLDQQKKNELFKALPPEIKTHIISFVPSELTNLRLINKEFNNLIADENGNLKINFLQHIAEISFWGNTPEEKIAKLFTCAFKRNDVFIFKNLTKILKIITDKQLILPRENYKITQKNLIHLAAINGFANVIEKLNDQGGNLQVPDQDATSPLEYAMIFKQKEAIEKLIELELRSQQKKNNHTPNVNNAFYTAVEEFMRANKNLASLVCTTGPLSLITLATGVNQSKARNAILLAKKLDIQHAKKITNIGKTTIQNAKQALTQTSNIFVKSKNNRTPSQNKLKEQVIKKNKPFKKLPEDALKNIIAFIPQDSLNFASINKSFKNMIIDETNGDLTFKDNFIRHIAGINSWKDDTQTKVKKLWNLISQTGYTSILKKNFKTITGEKVDTNKILDENNTTPLHLAARHGKETIVDWLIKHGAQVKAKDKNNKTPLYNAVENGHAQIIEKLVRNGARIKKKGYYFDPALSKTMLHLAAARGHTQAVETLIKLGSHIENADRINGGKTALHIAAAHGREKAIIKLVELGANIEIKIKSGQLAGKTALDLYREFCKKNNKKVDPEIVKLLTPSSIDHAAHKTNNLDETNHEKY